MNNNISFFLHLWESDLSSVKNTVSSIEEGNVSVLIETDVSIKGISIRYSPLLCFTLLIDNGTSFIRALLGSMKSSN